MTLPAVCSFSEASTSLSISTGKERDTESGNDYFEARYYSSAMGRFMSPDWSAKEDPVPYAQLDDPQSLNLYSYVRNNPLSRVDADGHQEPQAAQAEQVFEDWVSSGSGQETLNTVINWTGATAAAGFAWGSGLLKEGFNKVASLGMPIVGSSDPMPIVMPSSSSSTPAPTPAPAATPATGQSTPASPGPGGDNKPKKTSTPNQMNQEVRRGQAPKDVTAVHTPHTADGGNGQNHVHLADGSAQNQDGTAHHGTPSLTNAVKDWLKSHGW